MIIILREGQSTTTSCRPVDRDFLILNTSNPWHLHNVNHKTSNHEKGNYFSFECFLYLIGLVLDLCCFSNYSTVIMLDLNGVSQVLSRKAVQ